MLPMIELHLALTRVGRQVRVPLRVLFLRVVLFCWDLKRTLVYRTTHLLSALSLLTAPFSDKDDDFFRGAARNTEQP